MLLAGHYSLESETNEVLFGVADCLCIFNSFVLLQIKESDKWVMCCACKVFAAAQSSVAVARLSAAGSSGTLAR